MTGVAVTLFSLILGSFLNAILYRYNTGRSALSGRSCCMHCGHRLGVLDLVPLFSYAWLKGRCRYCFSKVSWQYPLVEAAAALLGLGVYLQTPSWIFFGIDFCLWLTLLFIVVYDFRHFIIPWSALALVAVLSLAHWYLAGWGGWNLAAGLFLAAPLLLISLISKGRWMGWGDGLLEISLGWLLGLSAGGTAFVLAFWAGALVGIGAILLSKRYTMNSEVPFAPFLILGAGCAYFLHVDFFQTVASLFL